MLILFIFDLTKLLLVTLSIVYVTPSREGHFTSIVLLHEEGSIQGTNVRKVNCGRVYSAYILKPVLSGQNL